MKHARPDYNRIQDPENKISMDLWHKKKLADLDSVARTEMELNECLIAKHLDCCCGMTTMEIGLPLTDEDIKKLEEEQRTISIEPEQASYKGYK